MGWGGKIIFIQESQEIQLPKGITGKDRLMSLLCADVDTRQLMNGMRGLCTWNKMALLRLLCSLRKLISSLPSQGPIRQKQCPIHRSIRTLNYVSQQELLRHHWELDSDHMTAYYVNLLICRLNHSDPLCGAVGTHSNCVPLASAPLFYMDTF